MKPSSSTLRLSMLTLGALAAACTDRAAPPAGVAPERLPTEVEKVYQEREALRFGIDQLEQEAAAQRRLEDSVKDHPSATERP